MAGSVAVIVVEPGATAVTTPFEPSALVMVATPVFVELHVTNDVRSSVEPSAYVPVAVNGCVVPTAMLELTGVTVMDTRGVLVTKRVAVLKALFTVSIAVMVNDVPVTPVSSKVARPFEPMLLLTANAGLFELQVTADVQLSVALSVNVAVAVNCCVVPAAMIALAGVMEIDFSVPLRIQLNKPIAVAESTARTTTQ